MLIEQLKRVGVINQDIPNEKPAAKQDCSDVIVFNQYKSVVYIV